MKRGSQSYNPSFIVKTIPSTDRAHTRTTSLSHEKCPYDVGGTYITVPVHKINEKFTKKQIKDASSMYTVQSTSSHSFVLSLKSEPSIHIAVPYYRISESNVGGKMFVSVSNFFPIPTLQATPPPGVNVIGQTAQLFPVDSDSLSNIFVYPEVEEQTRVPLNTIPIERLSDQSPKQINSRPLLLPTSQALNTNRSQPNISSTGRDTSYMSSQPVVSTATRDVTPQLMSVASRSPSITVSPSLYGPTSQPMRSVLLSSESPGLVSAQNLCGPSPASIVSDTSSEKRLRVIPENEILNQSRWEGNEFMCAHTMVPEEHENSVDMRSFGNPGDFVLYSNLIRHIIQNGSLKMDEVSHYFAGSESMLIKMANILVTLRILEFRIPKTSTDVSDGMYILFGGKEAGEICIGDEVLLTQSVIEDEEKEILRIRQRVELLEKVTQMDGITVSFVVNELKKSDPLLTDDPFYKILLNMPFFQENVECIQSDLT